MLCVAQQVTTAIAAHGSCAPQHMLACCAHLNTSKIWDVWSSLFSTATHLAVYLPTPNAKPCLLQPASLQAETDERILPMLVCSASQEGAQAQGGRRSGRSGSRLGSLLPAAAAR